MNRAETLEAVGRLPAPRGWELIAPSVLQLLAAHLSDHALTSVATGRASIPAAVEFVLGRLGGRHSTSDCAQCAQEA